MSQKIFGTSEHRALVSFLMKFLKKFTKKERKKERFLLKIDKSAIFLSISLNFLTQGRLRPAFLRQKTYFCRMCASHGRLKCRCSLQDAQTSVFTHQSPCLLVSQLTTDYAYQRASVLVRARRRGHAYQRGRAQAFAGARRSLGEEKGRRSSGAAYMQLFNGGRLKGW